MNKKELETLIYTENKTQREVAKEKGVSEACVSKWMKRHGIVKTSERRWIGKTYGSLTVLSVSGKDKYSHAILDCVCECGTKISVLNHSLTSGNTKTCGCKSRKRGSQHPHFKGFERIQASHWGQYISGATKRGLDFDITMEYAWGIYINQNRLCALSGQPIYFPRTRKQKTQSTASLDRIDSSKGYIPGNVQWIHKEINRMKSSLSEKDFLQFIRQIAEYKQLV
jgi:hypothetical protein